MPPARIHQAIHGYRDGHRLLSSSLSLNADAARTMLVLSDMSGPAMQPGFDEYLTGYPLAGGELYVFARTWYATEMQRPGCVWTHSLLLDCEHVAHADALHLLARFQRPREDGVETAAMTPFEFDGDMANAIEADGFGGSMDVASLVRAVLGQARPVIVTVDEAGQLELAFLQLWEALWPAVRRRFSFCTGALMPRTIAGKLMDLQAVPRAIPSSQFRKSAGAALVLDVRKPVTTDSWVELYLKSAERRDTGLRAWLDAAAGGGAPGGVVPSLLPIFYAWREEGSSAPSVLAAVVAATGLDPTTRCRLVGMVFERADAEAGASGRRALLETICRMHFATLGSLVAILDDQTRRLFDKSRAEGVALVLALLRRELTEVGERVLRTAVLLLAPDDLENLSDAQASFLPTLAGANPQLAASSVLWRRIGGRGVEVLSQLHDMELADEERSAVVDAVIASGCDVSVDALTRFGGRAAISRGLAAIASGQLHLSWAWCSVLASETDAVLEWLERLASPSLRDLDIGSRLVSPKAAQSRLVTVWKRGTADATELTPRVAAFGLTLAFLERDVNSPLLAMCFQPTFDAAARSRLAYEEWEWLREQAPAVTWYREWDQCERLAAALARLLESQNASLETLFASVHSYTAISKVAAILGDDRDRRWYLKALQTTADTSSAGTPEQRDALLGRW